MISVWGAHLQTQRQAAARRGAVQRLPAAAAIRLHPWARVVMLPISQARERNAQTLGGCSRIGGKRSLRRPGGQRALDQIDGRRGQALLAQLAQERLEPKKAGDPPQPSKLLLLIRPIFALKPSALQARSVIGAVTGRHMLADTGSGAGARLPRAVLSASFRPPIDRGVVAD